MDGNGNFNLIIFCFGMVGERKADCGTSRCQRISPPLFTASFFKQLQLLAPMEKSKNTFNLSLFYW